MPRNVTQIKKIHIDKFRALNDIALEFGSRITIISGKNGTAKSSILGILAQTFNFRRDPLTNRLLKFKTLNNDAFKSAPKDHFRLSKKYDKTGTMSTKIFMYDGYTNQDTEMQLRIYDYSDRPDPRPVMRGNKTVATKKNTSWNPAHPVIYLSLSRLMPITNREDYSAYSLKYLEDHKDAFLNLNSTLLNKQGTTRATATTGSMNSAVAHGENYDQDAVSAGEDNAGQLTLALMSFRKLKEEYSDYKGGLLLIDEADAGLFPAAQIALIKILAKECKSLNLQVIMTSHSPTMIEEVHNLSKIAKADYKTIYLSDTYGSIESYEDWSWQDIYADLMIRTVEVNKETLPKVNIYFEDKEACDLFNNIVTSRSIKKTLNQFKEINLGCAQYNTLIEHGIPEFTKKSLIVLDGDAKKYEKHSSVVLLPTDLPPDQLLFEYLYNKPDNHKIWKNSIRYNKPVFRAAAAALTARLNLQEGEISLLQCIEDAKRNGVQDNALRDMFKDFYKAGNTQSFIKLKVKENPIKLWCSENKTLCEDFTKRFTDKLIATLVNGYGLDSGKVMAITK
ncbi:AAA family ATPase [Stutzerimonas stutzeri]|uniref:AAA family ATPase n=1 Tax=Stutzerimonas stutzeri TaxID=316 RepID=UPI0003F789CB|nr:AAA family ATPase [Stutzerimonas stutzeri]